MSATCGHDDGACRCDERVPSTPLPVSNPPGQPALRRRVATQATAKATMLRALSATHADALADFTARTDDDFAVALVDAAAVVADIVTFYTDAFCNEHYLRTATERRSVTELARLLGYQVQPGLAPTANLAFMLDPTQGSPAETVIAAGTSVQSSPDPGQLPVVYETLDDLVARPAWNAMAPRRFVPHPDRPGTSLSFAGTVNVGAGDGVLLRSGDATAPIQFGIVTAVVGVDSIPPLPGRAGAPARTSVTVAIVANRIVDPPADLLPAAATGGRVPSSVSWIAGRKVTAADLDAALAARSTSLSEIGGAFAAAPATPATALLFRQQRAIFGSQGPLAGSVAANAALEVKHLEVVPVAVLTWASKLRLPWEDATLATYPAGVTGDIFLDGAGPAVPIHSMIVVRDGSSWAAYAVADSESASVAASGISGRATRVHVATAAGLGSFNVRRTTVFAAPISVALADVPAPETLALGHIELDGLQLGLRAGRPVIVTGASVDDAGHPSGWVTALGEVVHDFGTARSTTLTLTDPLPAAFARSTTTVNLNVVDASQGETRREILGSGDGRRAFQSFTLRQPPLTYLSAGTANGRRSTLTVWVDEVQWTPVDSFASCGPSDRVYVVRDVEGSSVVQFGDGVTGARLPTGAATVRAVYRTGGGIAGRVRAGQLSLPTSRSGGVTAVTNPAASIGGIDPETIDSARASAPLRVTTLDRIVSLADYALYARAFPGVAKAQAVWARAAGHRGVLVTAAGAGGDVLAATVGIGASLVGAIGQVADPLVPFSVVAHAPRSFRLAVNVRTDPARVRGDVLATADEQLRSSFSFDARDLGQAVAASEVLALLQGVTGVVAATITSMWIADGDASTGAPGGPPSDLLVANAPLPGIDIGVAGSPVTGAELLVLDRAPVAWGVLP